MPENYRALDGQHAMIYRPGEQVWTMSAERALCIWTVLPDGRVTGAGVLPEPIPHRWDGEGEQWICMACGQTSPDPCTCPCHAARPWPGYCQACGAPLNPPNATSCKACGADDIDD